MRIIRRLPETVVLGATPLWMGVSLVDPGLRTELASLIRARVAREGKFTKLHPVPAHFPVTSRGLVLRVLHVPLLPDGRREV